MGIENCFDIIEKLNFVRISGTPEEAEAARILIEECKAAGVEAQEETFPTKDGCVEETYLEVLEPYNKVYTAIAYRRSGCADAEAEMVYAEDALDVNLADVKGKIIYINTGVNKTNYEKLVKAGPVCVITGSGTVLDKDDETDLLQGMLRPVNTDEMEDRLCAVTVREKDLFEMIVKGASKAKVVVKAHDFENTSRNVLAFIKGTKYPDEVIAFTAHMDTTQCSHGTYDNAAGSAILMALARCYAKNPPARSLRFIWTGSEERGLLGSKYFVSAHADEVKNTRLCINVDLAASIAGHDFAIVTGPEALTNHIDMLMKESGRAVAVKTDTYSSDCIPFADSGVPAVSLGRFGAPGMSYIHNRYDVIEYTSAASLAKTCEMVMYFTDKCVNACVLPFERKISDDMKKKIDNYLQRK